MTHKPPQGIDAPNCAHKLLKKQMVGEQFWYVCECGQKFRIEMWDGKVSVREPGADTGTTPPPQINPKYRRAGNSIVPFEGREWPPILRDNRCEVGFLDRIVDLLNAAAERGTTPPEGLAL